MVWSPLMTSVASAASCASSARLAWRIDASTKAPMRSTASRISCSSRSRASRGAGVPDPTGPDAWWSRSSSWASIEGLPEGSLIEPPSAEPTGHIVLGQLLLGIGEDLDGGALLHDVTGVILAHVQEDRL